MRKPAFCICENKDADQLRVNRKADQSLCFCYTDSTIPLLSKSKILSLAIFCGCAAMFESDLVGNPKDRISHNAAHILKTGKIWHLYSKSKTCYFCIISYAANLIDAHNIYDFIKMPK